MKKSVLERKMFVGASPKRESNGILTGFDEEIETDYEERTPDNLEIIANNIRGDIRSMDERYMELAQMVGEAAFDTPEEVVTLMQAQFAQPAAPQGIASVGAPQVPPAAGGIMSGMAPQQPPVQMAQGGIVYRQYGSPPGGEVRRTVIDNQLLRQATERPGGIFSRAMGGMRDLTSNVDDRVSSFLSRQLQTTGPTSASGNPIPFVDKQGRFYQPVGGTNPNMPSRGYPMASRFNLGRFATRFGGPVAIGGGLMTDALIESDPSRGQLYGSMFELETGAGAENRPGFAIPVSKPAELPSLENMPGTPEQKAAIRQTGFTNIEGLGMGTLGKGPTPEDVLGFSRRALGPEKEPEKEPQRKPVEAPATTITPPPVDRAQEFRDRVKEKMDIYKEFLGDDPEFRKAQALFLLAESALNVAGAKGYSTGERLAKGLKGLPAGMAAMGAEAEKTRRAVAASAIGAVEQEFADARRLATTLAREQIRKGPGITPKVQSLYSSIKSRMPGMDDDVALQLATDLDNGMVKPNEKTGEYVDTLAGQVRWSPHKPLNSGSIGFLDTQQPFVRTSDQTVEPATLGEREDLLKKRVALQKRIEGNNDMLKLIYGDTVGFFPTIQSGVSQLVLSTFGDTGLGLTNVQKNQIRDRLQQYREELIKANLRNAGRPAVYDQKKMESLIRDPNALFASEELLISNVSNLQREDINELARIDSQLFGVPLKQLDRVPVGSKTDPLPLTPNSQIILDQMFTNRPNMGVWIRYPDGVTERMTAQQYRTQRQTQ